MNDHIKGLLALAFRAPEDSETFAALLSKLDNGDRGTNDLPGSSKDARLATGRSEGDEPVADDFSG
jgi:hypothetical protein